MHVNNTLHRYPRTRHLEGSFLPIGDDEADTLSFARFAGRRLVVSEKIDGANAAISFTTDGCMLLQSRSRFLDEEHFARGPYAGLHEWAQSVADDLFRVLGDRYVMYGEWVKKKQSVFYDALPSAFLELDILDTRRFHFLGTQERRALIGALPIASAPVLADGVFATRDELAVFLGPSRFKTPSWRTRLMLAINEAHLDVDDVERFVNETDPSDDMEGLYLKVEEGGVVTERAKLVRQGARAPFLHSQVSAVFDRPVENRVIAPVD
jgi:hypothetical protein